MPSRLWFTEFRRLVLALAAGAVAGALAGNALAGIAVAAIALLGLHLYQLHRLERWLRGPRKERQASLPGPWSFVYDCVYRLRRKSRKRKKRLRHAVDRVRQAAEATPDATVLLGQHDEIRWVNRSATELLGLRDGQDRHQPIGNLLRAPEFVAYLDERDFAEPIEMVSPVNEDLRLLVRLVPYGNNRHLLVARNITRLHRLEEMRKDFVANVSHELRSPLTVIVGYLETLSDDPDAPSRWARPLEQMSQQAARMCSIVEDLLRLSHLESGPDTAPEDRIEVGVLLRSVVRDAHTLSAGKHHIDVQAPPAPALLGDFNELFSAFSNIVFNAVQYTPDGGDISLSWEPRGDGCWAVSVTDTGEGIETEHVPRLTERFYRVDKARSRALGGTGLGLAIVKHILVRHGARLEVESVLGEGSTFSCVFPPARLAEPPAVELNSDAHDDDSQSTAPGRGSSVAAQES